MERSTFLINVKSIQELPSINFLINVPRHKKIKIIFDDSVNHFRESYSESLKKTLVNFQIAIHNIEPEINICKLITDEEIITNQLFFLQCAKDYRKLGEELIELFIKTKRIKLNENFPFLVFNQLKSRRNQRGKVGNWKYFLHGYHCHFQNIVTKQEIEVPYMFGMEFGDLDPYFFSLYIKSTPAYYPLPINIYEDFADGDRILKVMLQLGLLETINSNLEHHFGLVVKDREKINVKVFNFNNDSKLPKIRSRFSRLLQIFKF
nr:hypothetical protein [uncultured Chryseobacterium sp.]